MPGILLLLVAETAGIKKVEAKGGIMAKVALIRCESYDYEQVKKSVERGLDLVGGISAFVREGENILLKPNLLVGEVPDRCVTTNPSVFEAVAQALIKAGVNLSYGDSPGSGQYGKGF
jgi:uncharacterized protein (DUF362 family)